MIDPETPPSVLTRFSISTLAQDFDEHTVVASMPLGGMLNPLTGQPSIAGLAILVDDVAGRANWFRRGRGDWTVSSELTVELNPDAVDRLLDDPDEPVIASAHPLGLSGPPMLAVCTLTHCGNVIGGGTVHTMPIGGGPDKPVRHGADPLPGDPGVTLAQLMAVDPLPIEDGTHRLHQRPDPMVNNLIGIVHGGVSSAGLELVASAAINEGLEYPMRTASIRVNFLRPFLSGAQSVYAGTALRIGRTSAVADARAVGDDGKVAVIARVTGYR
ncbi:MAG: PaaI family thioesterase [Mycobacterium sp.]